MYCSKQNYLRIFQNYICVLSFVVSSFGNDLRHVTYKATNIQVL